MCERNFQAFIIIKKGHPQKFSSLILENGKSNFLFFSALCRKGYTYHMRVLVGFIKVGLMKWRKGIRVSGMNTGIDSFLSIILSSSIVNAFTIDLRT